MIATLHDYIHEQRIQTVSTNTLLLKVVQNL